MSPIRIFWTLCIALSLLLAQGAMAAHELTHLQSQSEAPVKSGLQPGHCDLCVLAASIAGGALPAAAAHVPLLNLQHTHHPLGHGLAVRVTAQRFFPARAPPPALL